MDVHAELVRLSELLHLSAGVLRDLLKLADLGGATTSLSHVAEDLDRLADQIEDAGLSGSMA